MKIRIAAALMTGALAFLPMQASAQSRSTLVGVGAGAGAGALVAGPVGAVVGGVVGGVVGASHHRHYRPRYHRHPRY